jgi:hypothetical protein
MVFVTSHYLTLTLSVGAPHLHSKKFANKELRSHNAHHPKSSVPYPTIPGIYNNYTLPQHPNYKINNDSACIAETRTRLPVWVRHRSLHDVGMVPCSPALVRADVHITLLLRVTEHH